MAVNNKTQNNTEVTNPVTNSIHNKGTYQITSKCDLPIWIDTTGDGNNMENLKNIVPLPAKEKILVTITDKRVSELQGQWTNKIDIKPYTPKETKQIW